MYLLYEQYKALPEARWHELLCEAFGVTSKLIDMEEEIYPAEK
jgi:hypothetical protein